MPSQNCDNTNREYSQPRYLTSTNLIESGRMKINVHLDIKGGNYMLQGNFTVALPILLLFSAITLVAVF